MRLFIALDFQELEKQFTEVIDGLKQLPARCTFPSRFHLTLKFLGEVSDDIVEDIKQKLQGLTFQKFSVQLGRVGVFPDDGYVRVVWVGITPSDQIMALQKEVDTALAPLFNSDTRFHPHITVARVKALDDKEEFKKGLRGISVESKEIRLKGFGLIKSVLTSQGSQYETLATFTLF